MIEISPPMLLLLLLASHALADFPLQGSFLAQAKNRNTEIGKLYWPWALSAHGLIHGGLVAIATGFWWMGLAEAALHAAIDWLKCERKIGLNVDQCLHIACKLLWFGLVMII